MSCAAGNAGLEVGSFDEELVGFAIEEARTYIIQSASTSTTTWVRGIF